MKDERDSVWDPGTDDPPVTLPRERGRFANALLTLCGLTAMAAPLALWIAWTQAILMTIFWVAIVCILVCWLIVHFDPED